MVQSAEVTISPVAVRVSSLSGCIVSFAIEAQPDNAARLAAATSRRTLTPRNYGSRVIRSHGARLRGSAAVSGWPVAPCLMARRPGEVLALLRLATRG